MIKKQAKDSSKQNIVTKYAFATRVGFMPGNPNKQNQDAFVLHPNFKDSSFTHLFGVCDGHGSNGKEASGYIKQMLPQTLESEKTYKAAFLTCDRMLNQAVDCNLSGSTVTMVLFEGNRVITLNAGDSRAIKVSLSKRGEKTHVEATPLTIDHKPELAEEKQRILSAGGRIQAFKDNDTNEDIGP